MRLLAVGFSFNVHCLTNFNCYICEVIPFSKVVILKNGQSFDSNGILTTYIYLLCAADIRMADSDVCVKDDERRFVLFYLKSSVFGVCMSPRVRDCLSFMVWTSPSAHCLQAQHMHEKQNDSAS